MKTKDFPQLAGKTIQSARLHMAAPDEADGDDLDMIFSDGSTFTISFAPSLPVIEFSEQPDVKTDGAEPTTLRGVTTSYGA